MLSHNTTCTICFKAYIAQFINFLDGRGKISIICLHFNFSNLLSYYSAIPVICQYFLSFENFLLIQFII